QHEIDFKYGDALSTADNAVTFRYTLKAIAQIYDLYATFMPKPIAGINGSGMHVHQSLFDIKKGKNLFFDAKDYYKLSKTAKYFIGGQLKHIKAMTAILNPLINSYKRLVPGYEAPVYISWAWTNRSALIRVPRVTVGNEKAVRCELRSPDPSCNPYLAFAVMLAAGLDGIQNKIEPPAPIEENLYEYDETDLKEHKVATLPENLRKAVKALKEDKVICDVLGEELVEKFCAGRMREWDEYKLYVTGWERRRYLDVY
ncbi:MAG: glutamine synthetase, partial [Candidatus Gracilibacteria bacterium]|nr:glutamine synthetase [Candidatus Gracilibacteria bacterium]